MSSAAPASTQATPVQTVSSHSIRITTTFVNPAGDGVSLNTKTINFGFLPDSFRVPMKSEFDRKQISLSSSQFLVYKYTQVPNVTFSVKVIAGLNDYSVSGGNPAPGGTTLDYLTTLRSFSRDLYSLVTPERMTKYPGIAPPKSVLTVGSMFKGIGVFDGVDIEYFGPYDELGRPGEMEVTFSFLPSQFYDPKGQNQTGVNLQPTADNPSIFSQLVNDPSGVQLALNEQANFPYIVYYGGQ